MIVSADAKCVIEVEQETLAGRDSASPLELKVAAFQVFTRCIKGPRTSIQGGIARHLGKISRPHWMRYKEEIIRLIDSPNIQVRTETWPSFSRHTNPTSSALNLKIQ